MSQNVQVIRKHNAMARSEITIAVHQRDEGSGMSNDRIASKARSLPIVAIIIYSSPVVVIPETRAQEETRETQLSARFGRPYCAAFGQMTRSSERCSSLSRMSWRI